jgi:hypothetical protein
MGGEIDSISAHYGPFRVQLHFRNVLTAYEVAFVAYFVIFAKGTAERPFTFYLLLDLNCCRYQETRNRTCNHMLGLQEPLHAILTP